MPDMRATAIASLLVLILLMSAASHPASRIADGADDSELARLNAELNATRAENARLSDELNSTKVALKEAREDRDAYAQRLESSTTILILALLLISLATAFFWLTARRQAMAARDRRMEEAEAARPPRRRG